MRAKSGDPLGRGVYVDTDRDLGWDARFCLWPGSYEPISWAHEDFMACMQPDRQVETYRIGLHEPSRLEPYQVGYFDTMLAETLSEIAQAFFDHRSGALGEAAWLRSLAVLRQHTRAPGLAPAWERSTAELPPDFVAFVEAQMGAR